MLIKFCCRSTCLLYKFSGNIVPVSACKLIQLHLLCFNESSTCILHLMPHSFFNTKTQLNEYSVCTSKKLMISLDMFCANTFKAIAVFRTFYTLIILNTLYRLIQFYMCSFAFGCIFPQSHVNKHS